ncbi:flavin reductase family protein [Microlunatus aurantiacus]|uniref:Flavin reductase family protein n=1 Tax=Microlunatus aurantiacus TaxID=446786 RepID=A0ABP7D031_9ACTN
MTEVLSRAGGGPSDLTSMSPEEFKTLFRQHPAGVAVITLRHRDRLVGFTATSVISVSADPPLIAFSLASGSGSWGPLAEAETVVVNFLSAEQVEVSARFATRGIDRFAGGGWSLLETGEPVLDDSPRWIRAEIVQRTPIGSSQLVCLRAISSSLDHPGTVETDAPVPPLVYHDRLYHQLGDHSAL